MRVGGQVAAFREVLAEQAICLGPRERVIYRHALNDRQSAVARAGNYTVAPDYRSFILISNIALAIKFNAEPRVDFVGDTGNPGIDFRFVPAKFPASSDDGWQFSTNTNGSQMIVDVRASSAMGTLRFYYQKDFFGSNTLKMNYRLQHLSGNYASFSTGFAFGVFESTSTLRVRESREHRQQAGSAFAPFD